MHASRAAEIWTAMDGLGRLLVLSESCTAFGFWTAWTAFFFKS
jgi:hypothetical protein